MKLARQVQITGKVQGIFFRKYIADKVAEIGGLTGFVRNEADGSVYMEIEGEREQIKDLVIACHLGNGLSQVSNIDVKISEEQGFVGFEVR